MAQIEILSNTTFKHKDYKYRLLTGDLYIKKFIKCEKLLKWFYPISKIVKIKNNFYFVRKFDKITPIPYNNYTISLLENDVIEPYNYYTNKNHIYVYDEENIIGILFFINIFFKDNVLYKNQLKSDKIKDLYTKYILNLDDKVIEKKTNQIIKLLSINGI